MKKEVIWQPFLQKELEKPGLVYTKYINRRLALIATWLAVNAGLRPNHITIISSLFSFLGLIILLNWGSLSIIYSFLAWLSLTLGYVLDSSDGQVARLTGVSSCFGEWLDHVLDALKLISFNLVIGYLILIDPGSLMMKKAYVALTINIMAQLLYFFGWNFKVQLYGKNLIHKRGQKSNQIKLASVAFHITDYGIMILMVILAYNTQLLADVYFVYGVITFLILMGYLLLSSRVMILEEKSKA